MTSDQLTPFCFATDGNSIYATAYAYHINESFSDYPEWLVLLKANTSEQQSNNQNTDPASLSWSVANAVSRLSVNLLPGVRYSVSCGASDKTGMFELHAQVPSLGNSFSIRMPTTTSSTDMSQNNSPNAFQVFMDDFTQGDRGWIPSYDAPLFSLMDIAWPVGVSNNTIANTTITTTPAVIHSSDSSTEWVQVSVSTQQLSLATSVNGVFPVSPQSVLNNFWGKNIDTSLYVAAAYDNNTIYTVYTNNTDTFISAMPIVLQSDMTTINGTLGGQYKIPGSVACTSFATMIAAKNRYVHVICHDEFEIPAFRYTWDTSTNLEPIVTPLRLDNVKVYLGGWPISLNMVPLYTNDTGYAESFVFSDGKASYSINSAGDMTVYAITNFGGNFTSINPNYKAPPKLSVSSIILIVIGAIAVAVGLFFARRWFMTRRNRKGQNKEEYLGENPAGIALEDLHESHNETTVFIPNRREVGDGRATEQQPQHSLSSVSTITGHGRNNGLELVAFSTHPSPTIVTTNVSSS